MLGIVHNRAIDALRRSMVHDRRRASDEGIEERFESGERTDVEAARRDEAREVRTALRSLPDEQSQVIELAYFGGFSQTRDRRRCSTRPLGTVKGRMRLGLKKMRGELNGLAEAMPHELRAHDDAGAWVLGALPEDEERRFAAHLETCAICRREVAELQMVADTLPLAAVQVAPPPELKDRIMSAVRAEAEVLQAAGPEADASRASRRREAGAAAAPAPQPLRDVWRRPFLSLRPVPAAFAARAPRARRRLRRARLRRRRVGAHGPGAGRRAAAARRRGRR